MKFIDLFCGIGGFRIAFEQAFQELRLGFPECVFSSDIDSFCRKSYLENFKENPFGDITSIEANEIPGHDILFAGFPCQPFSIIGDKKGFGDTKGTLFFEIERILKAKRPKAFVLENVKQLLSNDKGRTFNVILKSLKQLDYKVSYKVLNALDFGLPQKRERVIIIGHKSENEFLFPSSKKDFVQLSDVLENNVPEKYYASERIIKKRHLAHKSNFKLSIWHENKSGNISSYPYSCALRANASYNYLLVNGERRLTPREMLRLQGFPDSYKIIVSDRQAAKQAGNAVPVNMIKAVMIEVIKTCF